MARKLSLGPGQQPAIDLPPSQEQKPAGITRLDPYAWDMYCTAWVLEVIVKVDTVSSCDNEWRADIAAERIQETAEAMGLTAVHTMGHA